MKTVRFELWDISKKIKSNRQDMLRHEMPSRCRVNGVVACSRVPAAVYVD